MANGIAKMMIHISDAKKSKILFTMSKAILGLYSKPETSVSVILYHIKVDFVNQKKEIGKNLKNF